MEFCVENIVARTKGLAKEFGGSKQLAEEIVQETADVAPVVTEQTTEATAKRKARLVIEVPSLEELEETLASFGFRLEFIPR